jgi:streptomycin 6-kinase
MGRDPGGPLVGLVRGVIDRTYFPESLPIYSGLRRAEGGEQWLAGLPELVEQLAAEWSLRLEPPFHGGSAAWVAPATLPDGTAAVLKISWPHREAREEATALRLWDGHGACRLLAEDRDRYALLIERCQPGVPLSTLDAAAEVRLGIAADVLRRLWTTTAATAFEKVADVTAEWAHIATERMERIRPAYDPGLVREGIRLLELLPATATRSVLVHGDFNPGNVLSAQRAGWLAIDAKPMVGDPGYDPSPLLLQVDPTTEKAALAGRFRLFAESVGEPADRLLAWSFARTVEAALWSANRGEPDVGAEDMATAGILASLLD